MNIIICDQCYSANGQVVQAADVVPEIRLPLTGRKIRARALCAEHLEATFPQLATTTKLPGAEDKDRKTASIQQLPEVSATDSNYLSDREVQKRYGVKAHNLLYHRNQGHLKPDGRRVHAQNGVSYYVYRPETVEQFIRDFEPTGAQIPTAKAAKR